VSHLRLEWLAWLPGRIEIPDLAQTGDLAEGDLGEPSMRFRGLLARGLAGLTTDPTDRFGPMRLELSGANTSGTEGYFLDVLGRGEVEHGTLLGSVLGFVRAASPNHAYEVRGALIRRDGSPSYGIALQVVRLPGQAGAPIIVWAHTTEEALSMAAHQAIALILPRTRLCRAPWTSWRRRVMPADLLHAYESARELELARRYDEAMGCYHRALEEDPSNLGLRLQIARLEEKLGLVLDALASYEDLMALAVPASPLRRLRPPIDRAHRVRDRHLAIAAYRRALLLAQPALAVLWERTGPLSRTEWTARDRRLQNLRERLAPALYELCRSSLTALHERRRVRRRRAGPVRVGTSPLEDLISVPVDWQRLELQEVFQLAALDQLRALKSRAWQGAAALTRAATGLSQLATLQRLSLTQHELGSWAEISPEVDVISHRVASIEPRRGFRTWEQHYNAAVVYALPLLHSSDESQHDPQSLGSLAIRAVEHLEHAVGSSDATVVATHRDWILSEDPDLDGLRSHRAFRRFESRYFPSFTDAPSRPRDVARWEATRYAQEVLAESAERWQATWERWAVEVDAGTSPSTLKTWMEDESRAWLLVQRYVSNYHDWRVRLELIVAMGAWGGTHGFDPVTVSFPRWAEAGRPHDEPVDGPGSDVPLHAVRDLGLRFREVQQLVGGHRTGDLAVSIGVGADELRQVEGWEEVSPALLARLCEAHASTWRALSRFVTHPDFPPDRLTSAVVYAQKVLEDLFEQQGIQIRRASGHRKGDDRPGSSGGP
jgi:tetratricopeptide (TPR) repeat protein